MSATQLPARAQVVIIGGGVIGTSIAYHLAHEGVTDVVLLERDRLTSGTTWHAAGLMTCFGSTSETLTGIRLYSRDLFGRLEAETGLSTGFRPVGLIEAVGDTDRLEEYRRVAAFQRRHGLEVDEISPREMAELFPLADMDGLISGFHVPGDGRVNPVDLTMSLARGARNLGVRIVEGVTAGDVITRTDGALPRITGVRTSVGDIDCETVVNCTGMWARQLGERHGVVIPNQAAEHYYLITDTIPGLDPNGPVFEDPARYGYYREEGGGMMVGLFEPEAAAWKLDGIPEDFSFGTLPPDWERMAPALETAMSRVPITLEAGVRTFFCGPESFTPDRLPAVGEAPDLQGYFVAAGLNSVGILSSGGLGRVMAHWIANGRPDVDVTAIDVARFRPHQLHRDYRRDRVTEVLGKTYAAHTPGVELKTGRGTFVSPVHEEMVAAGAKLKDVSGWESADWYAGDGQSAHVTPSWGRQPWFDRWEAEHRAVREAVGLIDMSFMATFVVTGADAGVVLERVSAGHVDGDIDRITYTQWLGPDGGIEADLTVTKRGENDFLVVASDTAHGHSLAWLRRQIGDADVVIEDVTEATGQLNVQGPLSRDLLAALTDADLSTDAFPFRTARTITVAGVEVLCVRITYVGELGYELYLPREHTAAVWRELRKEGTAYGLLPVGLKSLGSLRLEKAYRDYGHDIDNTDSVQMAGLGFAVDLEHDFIGREAVLAERETPRHEKLVQVLLTDPEPLLFGAEVLLRDGVPVGDVRSASYGWTLGGAVGIASVAAHGPVTKAWLDEGTWEVDVAGVRVPATVSLRPLYDPTSARVRT
ncbi:putative oxidoreductase protein [Janibacter sp. HTCC2649]|uniref:GcvT family protein n=1 Tax=Janibacter sp. HTCC2649 TaxID=313589 RepID=UPI0000670B50|nr:FAD-dependent oxidoreductase [Janibacter sp. HTCC2649]EAP99887.1 putative oxidoreductase protein [Janibacter sp. HTCC2649]